MDIQKRIKDFHLKAAGFHSQMAAAHQKCMEKSDMSEADSGFHAVAAHAHAEMGEYHCECLKAVDDDLGKGFGTFRGPDEPQPLAEGLSLIPRFGQRNPSELTAKLDPLFERITKVD